MPRVHRLQLGPATYLRGQPPARYKHNGQLRPCVVCGWAEHPQGRMLYSYQQIVPRGRYVWLDGKRVVEMEQTPSGEVVMRRFDMMQSTNYHKECEAERERERRKLLPKRESRIEKLQRELDELRELFRGGSPGGYRYGTGDVGAGRQKPVPIQPNPGKRPTDYDELLKASQTAPGFAHSGHGERVRQRFPPGSLADQIIPKEPRPKTEGFMEMLTRLEEMEQHSRVAQPEAGSQPESQPDPDSTTPPVVKPKKKPYEYKPTEWPEPLEGPSPYPE
jgi:hypothetical protein